MSHQGECQVTHMFVQDMQLAEPQHFPAKAPRRGPGIAQGSPQHATDLPVASPNQTTRSQVFTPQRKLTKKIEQKINLSFTTTKWIGEGQFDPMQHAYVCPLTLCPLHASNMSLLKTESLCRYGPKAMQ